MVCVDFLTRVIYGCAYLTERVGVGSFLSLTLGSLFVFLGLMGPEVERLRIFCPFIIARLATMADCSCSFRASFNSIR